MSTMIAVGEQTLLISVARQSPLRKLGHILLRPTNAFAVGVLLLFVIAALFSGAIAPYGSNQATSAYFASPNSSYPLGTDNLGRDVLSRVIYGARASLLVGVLAVGIGTLSGAALGIVTGYFGGVVDAVGQRTVDILMSLPGILLALVIAAGLGASVFNVSLAIGVAILPVSARVARGSAFTVRASAFVEAALASGAGHQRVLLRHILPNILAPLLVIASVQLGFAIISEASLSYLGLGIPLGTPSWGNMLSGSSLLYMQRAPWMGIAPGIALTVVILAANLLGDFLRDLFDPRLRGRG
jgi:peptide/nickel transport system permease protein